MDTETRIGEMCFDTSLKRTFEGLHVNVKHHSSVEAFMIARSNGEKTPAGMFGRNWHIKEGAAPLEVYVLPEMELLRSDDGALISINKIGGSLMDTKASDGTVFVNLGFLRLVGGSSDEGVDFLIKGVYSDKYVRTLRERIGNAERKFFVEFMRPLNLRVVINTMDLKG